MDVFTVEYESFLMNDKLVYDMFDFNDACPMDFITEVAFAYDTSGISLDLKPLPNSTKYAGLGHDNSPLVTIAPYLNQDQEEKSLNLFRENKEALG